jgi:hypothetical protein
MINPKNWSSSTNLVLVGIMAGTYIMIFGNHPERTTNAAAIFLVCIGAAGIVKRIEQRITALEVALKTKQAEQHHDQL